LKTQDINHSALKGLLREFDSDSMTGLSADMIAKQENRISKGIHSNDLCSLLAAYRLLDVIELLEITPETTNTVKPPLHHKMSVDFKKHEVCLQEISNVLYLKHYSVMWLH